MLCPALKTCLWLLILTGECCGWAECARSGSIPARSLHWDAALGGSPQGEGEERGSAVGKHWGAQHAPGTSIPPNASHPGDDSVLWQGGCKVPTCFMVMHSTVGEGDLSIGSAARCAQTFLSRHPRTHISGTPHSRRDLVRSHISNDSP